MDGFSSPLRLARFAGVGRMVMTTLGRCGIWIGFQRFNFRFNRLGMLGMLLLFFAGHSSSPWDI